MFRAMLVLALAVACALPALCADEKTPIRGAEKAAKNSNRLLKKYLKDVVPSASTSFGGWEPIKAIDGNLQTSWFSATNDAAALGTKPWVKITFPKDVSVSRVTVLGNREPNWPTGYTILSGLIVFYDKDNKALWVDENKGVGNKRDFEFRPKRPIDKVRSIQFTSLKDEGDKNPYKDIAIAEIQVE